MSMTTCQQCRHWKPLYSGEEWGVRSFADAPESERERIFAAIKALHEENEYGWDADDDWEHRAPSVLSDHVQTDWPMWGECLLTKLDAETPSLARAIDGSHYYAILQCRATFGCVQFAAHERSEDEQTRADAQKTPP